MLFSLPSVGKGGPIFMHSVGIEPSYLASFTANGGIILALPFGVEPSYLASLHVKGEDILTNCVSSHTPLNG